jgi:chromosome partitioning protein
MTLPYSMYDVVLAQCDGYEGVPITRAILETGVENLHLAPSELDLAVAEVLVQRIRNRTGILNQALEEVRPLYDYILIDLPPNPGLLMINGLCASDQVVVPVDPSIFSLEALEDLRALFRDVKRMAGHSINRITLILTRYVRPSLFFRMLRKSNPSQEVEARLREMFQTVFIVPESTEIYEAQREGIPISHYAPGSRVGGAYEEIARSISIGNVESVIVSPYEQLSKGG